MKWQIEVFFLLHEKNNQELLEVEKMGGFFLASFFFSDFFFPVKGKRVSNDRFFEVHRSR